MTADASWLHDPARCSGHRGSHLHRDGHRSHLRAVRLDRRPFGLGRPDEYPCTGQIVRVAGGSGAGVASAAGRVSVELDTWIAAINAESLARRELASIVAAATALPALPTRIEAVAVVVVRVQPTFTSSQVRAST
jgi:hypothetical protein